MHRFPHRYFDADFLVRVEPALQLAEYPVVLARLNAADGFGWFEIIKAIAGLFRTQRAIGLCQYAGAGRVTEHQRHVFRDLKDALRLCRRYLQQHQAQPKEKASFHHATVSSE